MEAKKINPPLPTEAVNIFADFTDDKKLKEDISKIEEKKKKTPLYYIGVSSSILKSINISFFLAITLFFAYYNIQESESFDLSAFDPVCWVFLWSTPTPDEWCMGIKGYTNKVDAKIADMKNQQYQKIVSVIGDIYSNENFLYSKEMSFIIWESDSRVKPLQILKEFDRLKNQFEPVEKSRITCNSLDFSEGNVFKITCDAYSSDWETKIVGFSGDKSQTMVQGTSISLANSFINFLQENATNFTITDKQKVFSATQINEAGPYTKRTEFTIEMIYNTNNLLD